MSSRNQQKNQRRAATAAKVEALMRRAEADAIARERARWRTLHAPGNSYIAYVGYRNGTLCHYRDISPNDCANFRDGEQCAWYRVDGFWVPWGWFDGWDKSQYEPSKDQKFAVYLDGGGQGIDYLVPLEIPLGTDRAAFVQMIKRGS
jgi:hypothetical protein